MYFDLSNPIELISSILFLKKQYSICFIRKQACSCFLHLVLFRVAEARIWSLQGWFAFGFPPHGRAGKSTNNWICIGACVLRLHKISPKFDARSNPPPRSKVNSPSQVWYIWFVLLLKMTTVQYSVTHTTNNVNRCVYFGSKLFTVVVDRLGGFCHFRTALL